MLCRSNYSLYNGVFQDDVYRRAVENKVDGSTNGNKRKQVSSKSCEKFSIFVSSFCSSYCPHKWFRIQRQQLVCTIVSQGLHHLHVTTANFATECKHNSI